MKWVLLFVFICANSLAAVFVKTASLPPRQLPALNNLWPLITNLYLVLGLATYAVAFLFYASALAHFPLNIAFPLAVSGSFMLTFIASILLFQESFSWVNAVGVFLILVGIFLTTRK